MRMPVSVFVSLASSCERWCWTTNERDPTRHSAWPGESIQTSLAGRRVKNDGAGYRSALWITGLYGSWSCSR